MIAKRHWLSAAVLALALHVLVFAVFARSTTTEEGAEAPGEGGIEIDLGMLGDLSVETEAVEVVQAPAEPTKPPKPEPAKPAPTPPKPDPVVSEPVPPKQTAEVSVKEPPKAKLEPEPEPEFTSDLAEPRLSQVLPDAVSTKDAAAAPAPKVGSGSGQTGAAGGNQGARSSYLAEVAAKLARAKRYPMVSRRRRQEGVVGLSFVIDRQGRIVESSITSSSGHPQLDTAVLRMLDSVAPLPAFPDDLDQKTLSVSIPVAFQLSDRR